ncbi:hypothetical protein C6989_07995 [Nitrosopumilus sp. b2]|nr:hypothetical protein C6989_07995 [Nitrosopumilus sp. b2]
MFQKFDSKFVDYAIIGVVLLFFIGILAFEYKTIGLSEPLLLIPIEWKSFFDGLIWPLVVLLILDLVLKYKKVNDPKKFVKKYWIDIVMLILIPIFSAFKFLKIGLSLIKKLKTAKMSAKALHKTKKVVKK